MVAKLVQFYFVIITFCYAQNNVANTQTITPSPTSLHNRFSEKLGNFSIEMLYHTSKSLESGENLIVSPISVWTVMVVTAEGAEGQTLYQMRNSLRLPEQFSTLRSSFQNVAQWLQVHTNTVELRKLNSLIVDKNKLPERDFQEIAETYYDTKMYILNFSENGDKLADSVNQNISRFTEGKIQKLVESSFFADGEMLLISAIYFKGQWTVPFGKEQTKKSTFYDPHGKVIGEVNMMYKRYNYPYANIKELQARVIEIPYGKENRLSMLVLLPDPNVTSENMFFNLLRVPLDTVFSELKRSKEEFSDDEVDLFLPRFKIESSLELVEMFKTLGIIDLFDERAWLSKMSRTSLHVTKILHKAEIEVTEEGTTAAAVTAVEFGNRIGNARFDANRPFVYMIVEKVTNTIVFGGLYRKPYLY